VCNGAASRVPSCWVCACACACLCVCAYDARRCDLDCVDVALPSGMFDPTHDDVNKVSLALKDWYHFNLDTFSANAVLAGQKWGSFLVSCEMLRWCCLRRRALRACVRVYCCAF
jgi:hypothetical protein